MESDQETFRVLIVEDDADTRANLRDILELDDFEVATCATGREVLAFTGWPETTIVILDGRLPDATLRDLLPRITELAPHVSVVVVTGYGDLDGAVAALRCGAADYILKPVNADALRASLARIVDRIKAERELKRARERALQNERLAAIGETMAGLVHESRNALQRCKACLEMLELEVQDRPEALELVGRGSRALDDLRQLSEEVREYAAPIVLHRQPCNLAELWRDTWLHLAQVWRGKDLRLHEDLHGMDLRCCVDPSALNQVWRNILENAIHASPPAGLIQIGSAATQWEGRPAIAVTFRDQGPGLSAEQRRRIFEPFFTTKTKGTGLGMAISERIIQSHGGHIAAHSRDGQGAEIEVVLPRGDL